MFLILEFLDSGKETSTFASQVIRSSIIILSLKYLGPVTKDANKQCLNKNSLTTYCQSKKYSEDAESLAKAQKVHPEPSSSIPNLLISRWSSTGLFYFMSLVKKFLILIPIHLSSHPLSVFITTTALYMRKQWIKTISRQ